MYDDALVFDCQQCGECCVGFGGTYVSAEDIRAIASFMDISETQMRKNFCQQSDQGVVLAISREGRCVFQKNNICAIHPVKPRMCREWPFIPAVIRQPGNWRLMAQACPGIRPEASSEAVRACTLASLAKTRPGFTPDSAKNEADAPDKTAPLPV
ncbi:YkgJ family cysteine cluster protein [Desulfobotulus sp.]|jgi:Fe-S-cluster containining protein|uniref:YkgJ family cysteine cluster protein n=1 Tax=Desulfobotulus sp. TaxID=1940337 RepID=UPI002A366ED1|nr:YkgJ family cysteine cluster protein [Desulfobotulus sp.]MDY0163763.1 YkgJ family cysteine cluster protein [Desulfobotulus sp.]